MQLHGNREIILDFAMVLFFLRAVAIIFKWPKSVYESARERKRRTEQKYGLRKFNFALGLIIYSLLLFLFLFPCYYFSAKLPPGIYLIAIFALTGIVAEVIEYRRP